MKIQVHFYAQLRDLAGAQTVDVDLPENAAVSDLLEMLYSQIPALRSQDKNILVGAGLEFVERNYKLKSDEDVSIMPPVQGG